MNKIENIKINAKQNWTGQEPIFINNMFLSQDWNKLQIVETISSSIDQLSALKESVSSGDIANYLEKTFRQLYPNYIFSINANTGYYQSNVSGISSIKYKNEQLPSNNFFIIENVGRLVNTFNHLSGDLFAISAITINGITYTGTNVNLGNYIERGDQKIVLTINDSYGVQGKAEIITSIKVNGRVYDQLENYYLKLDLKDQYFKLDDTLISAKVQSNTEDNSIVNLKMFEELYKTSMELNANTLTTIQNVIDWICITNKNFNKIEPKTAKLVNNTLTIEVEEPATIYFIKST